jgi:hypothetical protein
VIAVTEQLLDMEPSHTKGLFFKAKAQVAIQEYEEGIATLEKLV